MTVKLTKSVVDSAVGSGKLSFVWDSVVSGFGLAIYPTGLKSFILQYRTAEGRVRRYTVGKLSDTLTVDLARKKAKDVYTQVLNGNDPMAEKQSRREALTIDELLTRYVASPKFAQKAKTTKATDLGRIERHLRPLIGSKHADLLTADSIRKIQTDIKDGKTAGRFKTSSRGLAKVTGGAGTADKSVLILRAAYSWAISEGVLKDNPAAAVKVAQPGQREVIIGASDYAQMYRTLNQMETERRIRSTVADAIRLIGLTGARRGEVVGLLWEYVDLKSGLITLPPKAHKAGSRTGKPRIIALSSKAQEIIARQVGGEPGDYVFKPSKGEGTLNIAKPWMDVRKEAGLPANLGLHGLRHSLASHLAMDGASAIELMEALGHKQISTTQRYIHFAEQARSTLAERGAAMATAGMDEADGKQKAEVLPMKKPHKSKAA
ncbi:MAG: tyrosine-type recombinase/integrase [Rhodocyclaceae bacterium]|nr:tyrosine-type recombinase/integrase [Rhodocyclaceae bacterium]